MFHSTVRVHENQQKFNFSYTSVNVVFCIMIVHFSIMKISDWTNLFPVVAIKIIMSFTIVVWLLKTMLYISDLELLTSLQKITLMEITVIIIIICVFVCLPRLC